MSFICRKELSKVEQSKSYPRTKGRSKKEAAHRQRVLFVEPGKEYAITYNRSDLSKGDICFRRSLFCYLLASNLVCRCFSTSGTTLR